MTAGRLLVLLFMLEGEAESCAAQVSAKPMPRRRHLDAELPQLSLSTKKVSPVQLQVFLLHNGAGIQPHAVCAPFRAIFAPYRARMPPVEMSYFRIVTLMLPTLLLLSKALNETVCSPSPVTERSSE